MLVTTSTALQGKRILSDFFEKIQAAISSKCEGELNRVEGSKRASDGLPLRKLLTYSGRIQID